MSRMKIKICGLSRDDDISFANEAGPDYIGFVFAKSKRRVSPDCAARLRARLRHDIVPVGVFVNAPVEEIAALYRDGIIGIAQLHGDESQGYIAELKKLTASVSSVPVLVIKAVQVESREDILDSVRSGADYLLLDHGTGGTGKPFDWALLEDGDFLNGLPVPCFLAGGIDMYNIEEALRFKPLGIDVSSGAETGSVKDRDKMIQLVQKVRNWK